MRVVARQVLTGESWSEAVARPVIFTDGVFPYVAAIFYVSYIIICGMVLVNVAVAVLLEKMVDPEEGHDESTGIVLKDLPEHARTLRADVEPRPGCMRWVRYWAGELRCAPPLMVRFV